MVARIQRPPGTEVLRNCRSRRVVKRMGLPLEEGCGEDGISIAHLALHQHG